MIYIIPNYLFSLNEWRPFVKKALMEHVENKKVILITQTGAISTEEIELGFDLENQTKIKVGEIEYLNNVLEKMDENTIDHLIDSSEFRLGYCILGHDYAAPEQYVIGEAISYYSANLRKLAGFAVKMALIACMIF